MSVMVSSANVTGGRPRVFGRTKRSASSITWRASSLVSRNAVLRSQRTRKLNLHRASKKLNLTPIRALKSFDPANATIEGLTPLAEICDDFICKSSPAVEGSLRQIAQDICALREDKRSKAPYAPDVVFDDGARQFTGVEGFESHTFIADVIGNPKCAITKMKMETNDLATIEWRLIGDAPGGKADVNVVSTLTMNLITGRVVEHKESWNFDDCDSTAGSFLQTARTASATPKNIKDAANDAARKLNDAIASVDVSNDEEVFVDPNDPMKFFTESNKPQDDYLNYALFVAALWLVFEGLKATQTL